ncbi:MAG: hypothetical protein FJY07_11535, partial [Bacteroidetes bacterium]|nr:hypothetical protein [Bacteroidota bacterium]
MEQPKTVSPETFLAPADAIKFKKLVSLLKHCGKRGIFTIVASDTLNLHNALNSFFVDEFRATSIDLSDKPDKKLKSFFSKKNADTFHILSLFNINEDITDKTLQVILFSRDYISQHNLRLILHCDFTFLGKLEVKAYDLFSVSSFTAYFSDALHKRDQDFRSPVTMPQEIIDFEKTWAELKKYKRRKKPSNAETLMRKLLDTAEKAYSISKTDEALFCLTEGYELAKANDKKDFTAVFLGNIGG